MNRALVLQVRKLAAERCDYCRMPAAFDPLPFQVDHIVAQQHGGRTVLENLAWSCLHCNKHKGPNIAGLDPITGALVPLFHPRQQKWQRHFLDQFDPSVIARYGNEKRESLLVDPGIVRNRLKIESAIQNARAFLAVQNEFGTFDEYIWGFVVATADITGCPAPPPPAAAAAPSRSAPQRAGPS